MVLTYSEVLSVWKGWNGAHLCSVEEWNRISDHMFFFYYFYLSNKITSRVEGSSSLLFL